MGTVYHEAMIVTSYDEGVITRARVAAFTYFESRYVSEVSDKAINGYRSFMISTSGSKLGWTDYQRHQDNMREFVGVLKEVAFEDGSSPVEWVAVRYGSDLERPPEIIDLAAASGD